MPETDEKKSEDSTNSTDKNDEKEKKTTPPQGRMFHIENKLGKLVMSSNFENDEFHKMLALGISVFDHITGVKRLPLIDLQDKKDHI